MFAPLCPFSSLCVNVEKNDSVVFQDWERFANNDLMVIFSRALVTDDVTQQDGHQPTKTNHEKEKTSSTKTTRAVEHEKIKNKTKAKKDTMYSSIYLGFKSSS